MWQKVSLHKGAPLVGKHFVPFGKSGDMGDSITTQIIHLQNAMLKSTKQRVLTNLNDIDAIIEMETPETATDKLLPLPQPPGRARTDARTNPSAQRATQLRRVIARVYAVSIQNQITTTVP
jgi:hypothetical protein